jgi:hypothetical protein
MEEREGKRERERKTLRTVIYRKERPNRDRHNTLSQIKTYRETDKHKEKETVSSKQ